METRRLVIIQLWDGAPQMTLEFDFVCLFVCLVGWLVGWFFGFVARRFEQWRLFDDYNSSSGI